MAVGLRFRVPVNTVPKDLKRYRYKYRGRAMREAKRISGQMERDIRSATPRGRHHGGGPRLVDLLTTFSGGGRARSGYFTIFGVAGFRDKNKKPKGAKWDRMTDGTFADVARFVEHGTKHNPGGEPFVQPILKKYRRRWESALVRSMRFP